MSASTSGFQSAPGGWQWPDDLPTQPSPPHKQESASNETRREHETPRDGIPSPQSEKHWHPRTCRICLETVLPTYHPPPENLPGVFHAGPSVTYDSEGGRLLRPCKCKGSSRYVHESCLQEWRHADPAYGRRNFWECPTCHFRYRLERMQWSRWISSKGTQVLLTVLIFWAAVFALGFVADPIINLYADPYNTISSIPSGRHSPFDDIHFVDDPEDRAGWTEHFMKGFASLGLLGAVKMFFSLGPWHWFQMRNSGLLGGGSRAGTTGRDRVANISWAVVLVGVCTVLYGVWKVVRAWSRRVLEKAGERVMDVQGSDEDDDD